MFFVRDLRIIHMLKHCKLPLNTDCRINSKVRSKSEPLGFGKFAEFSVEDLEYYQEREKRYSTPFGKSLSNYLTWLRSNGILKG